MRKCKRQAGVEHETIAFPHFRSCASRLLYVGLDHLPLHDRRQLVLWFFYMCILKISPFALKILATMFMRKNVKNRNACSVG